MLQKLNFLLVSFLLTMSYGFAQTGLGTIKGMVSDKESEEPVYGATIFIFSNDIRQGAAKTDFDGKFIINSVEPGTYDVEVRNETEGYKPLRLEGVKVTSDQYTFLNDLTLSKTSDVKELEEVEVIAYKVPLIDKDGGASGATVTREEIA